MVYRASFLASRASGRPSGGARAASNPGVGAVQRWSAGIWCLPDYMYVCRCSKDLGGTCLGGNRLAHQSPPGSAPVPNAGAPHPFGGVKGLDGMVPRCK